MWLVLWRSWALRLPSLLVSDLHVVDRRLILKTKCRHCFERRRFGHVERTRDGSCQGRHPGQRSLSVSALDIRIVPFLKLEFRGPLRTRKSMNNNLFD